MPAGHGIIVSMAKQAHGSSFIVDAPRNAEEIEAKPHTPVIKRNSAGQFQKGSDGLGGRKPGSRNKLSESLLGELASVWESHGRAALVACAEQEPGRFAQICVGLLPKNVELDISAELRIGAAMSGLVAFRTLQSMSTSELKQIRHQAADEDV
jgi:hypothetical protein